MRDSVMLLDNSSYVCSNWGKARYKHEQILAVGSVDKLKTKKGRSGKSIAFNRTRGIPPSQISNDHFFEPIPHILENDNETEKSNSKTKEKGKEKEKAKRSVASHVADGNGDECMGTRVAGGAVGVDEIECENDNDSNNENGNVAASSSGNQMKQPAHCDFIHASTSGLYAIFKFGEFAKVVEDAVNAQRVAEAAVSDTSQLQARQTKAQKMLIRTVR